MPMWCVLSRRAAQGENAELVSLRAMFAALQKEHMQLLGECDVSCRHPQGLYHYEILEGCRHIVVCIALRACTSARVCVIAGVCR